MLKQAGKGWVMLEFAGIGLNRVEYAIWAGMAVNELTGFKLLEMSGHG